MFATISRSVGNFLKSEDGPTAVEYAVMMALIVAVCFASITTFGSNTANSLSYTGTKTARAGS